MKSIPFLALCALTYLPNPAEGTIIRLLFRVIFADLFFSDERDARDCTSVKQSTGLNITDDTEECKCFFYRTRVVSGLSLNCRPVPKVCLLPSPDTNFCTNSTENRYTANTDDRPLFAFSTSPSVFREATIAYFRTDFNNYVNTFEFIFFHSDDSTSSSKTYATCSVESTSAFTNRH